MKPERSIGLHVLGNFQDLKTVVTNYNIIREKP